MRNTAQICFDRGRWARCAELTQYLSETAYAACVPVFEKSFASFEKWCDDLLMQQLDEARRVSFGLAR